LTFGVPPDAIEVTIQDIAVASNFTGYGSRRGDRTMTFQQFSVKELRHLDLHYVS
jgi:hypothetical protein